MTLKEYYLIILAEECAETAERVSKCLRFTCEEIQPGQGLTNAERVVYEFNDIVAVMEVLQEMGVLHTVIDRKAIELKKEKIKTYTRYSMGQGVIETGEEDYHEQMYNIPRWIVVRIQRNDWAGFQGDE